jgi:ribonucleotide reductase alpha subunit
MLNEILDNMDDIASTFHENMHLASNGGGIGTYYGNMRGLGEVIKNKGQSSGVIPFIKMQDAATLAINQGGMRRGTSAVYLDVSHPEIEEFIDIRRPTGDAQRRSLNMNHAVILTDAFMQEVEKGGMWELKNIQDGKVVKTVPARELWIKILTTRIETGEPYLLFIDTVNKSIPEHHKVLDLKVKTSNLCVAPETLILVKDIGWVEIQSVADTEVEVWNGFEWSLVTPRKTAEKTTLFKVQLQPVKYNSKTEQGFPSGVSEVWATEYHRWYIKSKNPLKKYIIKQTNELKAGDKIIRYYMPNKLTGQKFKEKDRKSVV